MLKLAVATLVWPLYRNSAILIGLPLTLHWALSGAGACSNSAAALAAW